MKNEKGAFGKNNKNVIKADCNAADAITDFRKQTHVCTVTQL